MFSYIRIVYSRNEWNRAWLWDVGSLLALINGGVLNQIVTEYHVSSNYINLIIFSSATGLIFAAFVAVDVFFTHLLPGVRQETTFFKIILPFAIISSYSIAAFIGGKIFTVDTAFSEFLLVGLANSTTLICIFCLIKYYS